MSQKQHNAENQSASVELQSRRALLKMAAYVPPAILGVMATGIPAAEAATQTCTVNGQQKLITISANGTACCPCATNPTSSTCYIARCELGNCAACRNAIWTAAGGQKAEKLCKRSLRAGGCRGTCRCSGTKTQKTCV
jgi:GTP cyclohydrolase FolE2